MSYSRRQLYTLGEPLGESVTRKEGGRIIYGSGGGGTQQSTQVTDLPEWARPAAAETLERAREVTSRDVAYQPYPKERVAGFEPLQTKAFEGASALQPSSLGATAGQTATTAAQRALGAAYDPYQTGQFTSNVAAQYMNPYLEQAIAPQIREAQRASEIQRTADQARAVGAGAFGGSRQAIVEAERQRNLGQQIGDIRGRGYASAFDQAQQQFGREQQLEEQSRQYGAGLGMQGIQTALQGASQLGQLGGMQFGQQRDILGLQQQFGAQQQALEQQKKTQDYQDFLTAKKFPYQQIEFMSNILRGTPMGAVQTLYSPPANTTGQLVGSALGAYGAYMGRASGGSVSSYAEGGVTDSNNVRNIISKLSDMQLEEARKAAVARGDADQIQMIQTEMSERASMRRGIAAGIPDEFADGMEEGMASGGIVAFADKGLVDEEAPSNYGEQMGKVGELIGSGLRGVGRFATSTVPSSIKESFLTLTSAPGYGLSKMIEPSSKPAAAAPKEEAAPAPAPAAEEAPKKVPAKERAQLAKVVKEVAASAGVPEKSAAEKSMADQAMELYQRMQNLRKPEIEELNKIIEGQKGKAEEIKGRGLADALMNFGFTMAAKASKPGAKLLGSASEAAATIPVSLAENRKAAQAAQESYDKMRADQLKYQVALSTGDARAAETLARDIAKDRMDQKRLDQLIDYQNRSLAVQSAQVGRSPDLIKIANDIMSQPGFTGTRSDALDQASRLIGGVGMRTDFNRDKLFTDKVEKDMPLSLLNAQLIGAKTDADRAKIQAQINARRSQIRQDVYGSSGGQSGGSGAVDYSQWGTVKKVGP